MFACLKTDEETGSRCERFQQSSKALGLIFDAAVEGHFPREKVGFLEIEEVCRLSMA